MNFTAESRTVADAHTQCNQSLLRSTHADPVILHVVVVVVVVVVAVV